MNLYTFHNDCDFKLNETTTNSDTLKDGGWMDGRRYG